jgi:hypothetical protein
MPSIYHHPFVGVDDSSTYRLGGVVVARPSRIRDVPGSAPVWPIFSLPIPFTLRGEVGGLSGLLVNDMPAFIHYIYRTPSPGIIIRPPPAVSVEPSPSKDSSSCGYRPARRARFYGRSILSKST